MNHRAVSSPVLNVNPESRKPPKEVQKIMKNLQTTGHDVLSTVVLVPSRVPCGSNVEVFLLLKTGSAAGVTEVVFCKDDLLFRVKPRKWSDTVLCITVPDFPPGSVKVTVLSNEEAQNTTELLCYSSLEEMSCLLSQVANPVQFMCQALQVPSVERLDEALSSMVLEGMPRGGFQGLRSEGAPEGEGCDSEVPTMLHFAAEYGLKSLSGVLLQCPGAERAIQVPNRHGDNPSAIARKRGHTELHVHLKETLKMISSSKDHRDSGVSGAMYATGSASNNQKEQRVSDGEEGEEEDVEEDPYSAFDFDDIYSTIENPNLSVMVANRPPAPTPRPECMTVRDERISYMAKALQKTSPGMSELYSRPFKRAQGHKNTLSPTYDTFVALPTPELHQRVWASSLPVEGAKGHINHCQPVQKGPVQQDKLTQLRAAILNCKGDDVYDKINIVHHTPSVVANESRGNSQSERADFYSKPLKGHHANSFWKADRR